MSGPDLASASLTGASASPTGASASATGASASPTAARASLIGRTLDWLKTRLAQQSELAAMSEFDLGTMASDLGITQADLLDVLPHAADHSPLMHQMMLARGLDPARVRGLGAAFVRDLELTCTRCGAAPRCRQELAAGTAAAHSHAFCGNAPAFDEIPLR